MKSRYKGRRNTIEGLRLLLLSMNLTLFCSFCFTIAFSQAPTKTSTSELKKLSIEQLMDLEVNLVSRSPEKLADAASSVQVITSEDIRNSGATNIPEALRLVSNLQIAQANSHVWIISSRGFSNVFANKLLVMIDGRTVYTPLFGGVLWEMQHVLLEDIERIEVVSGPGGTLWGANAVNGIINIITKKTRDAQGIYAMASNGTFVQDQAALRYGGKVNERLHYKVYGMHTNRNTTIKPDGTNNTDDWYSTQGGFKINYDPSANNNFTLQGDFYGGERTVAATSPVYNGQNVLARWNHAMNNESDLIVQFYYDRYFREGVENISFSTLKTYDLDIQYRLPVIKNHKVLLGAGYRNANDVFFSTATNIGILPNNKNLDLYNAFIQDEISLGNKFKLTVGTKVLHNVYTGLEIQPAIRANYTLAKNNHLWAAISRAVRTPSRYDVDYFQPAFTVPPLNPSVAGGPNFVSEKLIAYELGYRIQPNDKSSFSLATYYNDYRDLYSVEALPGTRTFLIQNGSEGRTRGAEFSGTYQLMNKWRLRGGYTFFEKDLGPKAGRNFDPNYLSNDAKHQVLLHSMADLFKGLHLDVVARYLDQLSKTIATAEVAPYFTFDVRLAYTYKIAMLSLVGQNLYKENHKEFGLMSIPRGYYAKLAIRW